MTPDHQTAHSTTLDQYVQALSQLQTRVVSDRRLKLLQVAERMAVTTGRDLRIFLFGTGHSHLLDESVDVALDKWRPRNIHF
jgi:uncharacterized phosphosugar-binding protein